MTETEFKRGQKVYDMHGGEYLYADKVEGGHYANSIVIVQVSNYRGDDYFEETTEGPLTFLKQVFTEPPKTKINDEITALATRKKELAERVSDLHHESRKLENEVSGYKDKIEAEVKKYPHHQMFLHAASGGDLILVSEHTFEIRSCQAEMTFDVRTGSFRGKWESGSELDNLVAFKSLPDAAQYFLTHAKREWLETQTGWGDITNPEVLKKRYEAFELQVPKDIEEVVKRREETRLARKLAKVKDDIAGLKKYQKQLLSEPSQ